ncbi:MAG: penicillin-insensitive murein endopeptidase [Myxococcota bacterium]
MTLGVIHSPPAEAGSGGDPFAGWLTEGEAFPMGPNHRLQHHVNKSKTYYATAALVDGLLNAARHVADEFPGGQPLVVGNLSQKNGGDIGDSRSHNSGRDVDLVFFMTQLDGTSVRVRNHRYDEEGKSRRLPKKYKFDVDRNWAAIEALGSNKALGLQWVIIEPHLERLLLAHAKSLGVDAATLRHYADMMTLPAYAGPHENHVHIRVQCSLKDWQERCQPTGPVWPQHEELHRAVKEASRVYKDQLRDKAYRVRLDALEAIWAKGLSPLLPDALSLLDDPNAKVRRRARKMLPVLISPESGAAALEAAASLEAVSRRLVTLWVLRRGGLSGLETARAVSAGTHPTVSPKPNPTMLRDLRVAARRTLIREEPVAKLLDLD